MELGFLQSRKDAIENVDHFEIKLPIDLNMSETTDNKKNEDKGVPTALQHQLEAALNQLQTHQGIQSPPFLEACRRFTADADGIVAAAAATERLQTQDFGFRITAIR